MLFRSDDVAAPRLRIQSLAIPLLADIERRIHEHFYETTCSHHVPHVVAGRAVRAHGGTQNRSAVSHYFCGNEADAANVRVTILLAETEALRQMCSDDVSVEDGDLPTVF